MRVIGLMSGTSVDGIDAAVVDIAETDSTTDSALSVTFLAGETYPYPAALQALILEVCGGKALSMAELAELDDAIAYHFAQAALALQAHYAPVELIGSHGQTVFHRPPGGVPGQSSALGSVLGTARASAGSLGYSLQLGRGAAIARLTGVTTVSNFRAADIAVGGQGAPLVPAVDAALLSHPVRHRCVQNIGGIGNVTYLPATREMVSSGAVLGWDTGPGNALLDLAVHHLSHGAKCYDDQGQWAASGSPCQSLVARWFQHEFFHQPPPKSTGRELFGHAYLEQCLRDAEGLSLSPADILASLTELTAVSIVESYRSFLSHMPDEVLVCGGGSRNLYLRQRLQQLLGPVPLRSTDEVGIQADFKEAIAFAVLAYWRVNNIPGNLPVVTGAERAALLGEIYLATLASRDTMGCHSDQRSNVQGSSGTI